MFVCVSDNFGIMNDLLTRESEADAVFSDLGLRSPRFGNEITWETKFGEADPIY